MVFQMGHMYMQNYQYPTFKIKRTMLRVGKRIFRVQGPLPLHHGFERFSMAYLHTVYLSLVNEGEGEGKGITIKFIVES